MHYVLSMNGQRQVTLVGVTTLVLQPMGLPQVM